MKNQGVVWASASYRPGNTVITVYSVALLLISASYFYTPEISSSKFQIQVSVLCISLYIWDMEMKHSVMFHKYMVGVYNFYNLVLCFLLGYSPVSVV
jgi:hypothetical protein